MYIVCDWLLVLITGYFSINVDDLTCIILSVFIINALESKNK